ncbi:hypothetical protein D3C71_624530 [compost metagenome]
MLPYSMPSALPTVPALPPKLTPVTGTAVSAPSRSLVFTLPLTGFGAASSVTLFVSGFAVGTSFTISTVSVPLATSPSRSVTLSATASVTSPALWFCAEVSV